MKPQVAADIRAVFNAQDRAEAGALLKRTVQKYETSAPKLAAWLEENLPEGLTVFAFAEPHRRLLRTSNSVEHVTPIKPQPRDQAADPGGEHLPQRGVVPAAGERPADGDQRRLAGGQSLPDVHGTIGPQGCSQLLQKQLDTIFFTLSSALSPGKDSLN